MNKINIRWLHDEYTCGDGCCSEYAEGALVTLDGVIILDLDPVARVQQWDKSEVLELIIKQLGYTITEDIF